MNKFISVIGGFCLILVGLLSKASNTSDSRSVIAKGKLIFVLEFADSNLNSCISCHFINAPDTFAWGPSAYEISKKVNRQSLEEFEMLFSDPFGSDVLMDVHMLYSFDTAQVEALYTFISQMPEPEAPTAKPFNWHFWLVVFILMMMLLLVLDIIFCSNIKNKRIANALLVLLVISLVCFWINDSPKVGLQKDYQPDQPMKFSHQLHVEGNKIDCKYCHSHATHAKTGYIPVAEICMHCHTMLREGPNAGEFELNKLIDSYNNTKNIEWIKVHNLPDHVSFNHQVHVNNANVDCIQCHGKIENDHFVKQVEDFSMGWCLDCHRRSYVKIDIQTSKSANDSVKFIQRGGEDCMTCHY